MVENQNVSQEGPVSLYPIGKFPLVSYKYFTIFHCSQAHMFLALFPLHNTPCSLETLDDPQNYIQKSNLQRPKAVGFSHFRNLRCQWLWEANIIHCLPVIICLKNPTFLRALQPPNANILLGLEILIEYLNQE